MTKAIFHKEWIKTKGYFYIMLLVSLCFTGYSLLRMNRVVSFKGADHIWALLLTRDTIFIETLKYLPLAIGATLAAAQFIPEMQQKRLKLTLHLPYPPATDDPVYASGRSHTALSYLFSSIHRFMDISETNNSGRTSFKNITDRFSMVYRRISPLPAHRMDMPGTDLENTDYKSIADCRNHTHFISTGHAGSL